jgi:hypothetical protein
MFEFEMFSLSTGNDESDNQTDIARCLMYGKKTQLSSLLKTESLQTKMYCDMPLGMLIIFFKQS